jgi:hypothetical protein
VPSCSIGFWVARTKKGLGSGCVSPSDGDAALLHRLEQGRLGLGRGAVDLVGEDDVGEDRARLEDEGSGAGRLVVLLTMLVPVMSRASGRA